MAGSRDDDALPGDLLRRRSEEAVRLLALRWLAQAREGCARLDRDADEDALHDFRVAVRRLRSCLRAYKPALEDGPSKKRRARLKEAAEATNDGRDAEVQLAWVREHGEALPASHRDGLAPLIDRLEQRRREGYARARDEGAGAFAAVAPKLERSLSRYTVAVETDGVRPERFGVACASALREHAGALVDALEAVSGPGDVAHAHRARIAAKRLRYLLEPIADLAPGAPSAVKRLKGLQDALGELHDLHVLAAELSPQPGCDRPSPALAELRGRLQAEIAERWAAIAADWIRPGNGRDRKGVRALARKVDEVAEHAEEIAGASRKKGRNGRS